MRPNIDFRECLKDSPRFRNSLEEAETDLDGLEAKLEKLVKLCNGMIEAGKVYNSASCAFLNGVRDVATQFREDELVSNALARMTNGMNELHKYQTILLDQAHRSVCKNLNNFIRNDIRKVKETRKHFEKISDDLDQALTKNSQAPRARTIECEDANNVLTATRACFGHISLDYVFQLNILHSKKRFDVLDTLLAYMHAQNTYFHQGHDLFNDLEPYMKSVAAQLEQLSTKAQAERKEMEERHTLVQQRELSLSGPLPAPSNPEIPHEIKMEGYLFKRTTNAFKSWVRRWFMIQDNQLVYCKRSKDNLTVMEDDLRLCTVKPVSDIDRRFCFEILSPSRSHMLQADSEHECQAWINAFQAGISKAYRDSPCPDQSDIQGNGTSAATPGMGGGNSLGGTPKTLNKHARMEQLLAIPGNKECCDCGSPDPRWASINLGVTLCIECSGIHRSFGVHMSKVRSVTLDAWEPELLKVMAELGNKTINSIYEACVDESIVKRATPRCQRSEREAWIRAKYIDKAFVRRLPLDTESSRAAEGNPAKRWSVYRRKRRSPSKTRNEEEAEAPPSPETNERTLTPVESQDSGLGGSTSDVIIFGSNVNSEEQDATRNLVLEDSEESSSEAEGDPDSRSTTSFEDVSKLNPDLLLYRAAQARNLPVILQAVALGGNVNWHNDDEEGKTALIKAVESGSMAPCELLLLNGAKVDLKDNQGQSALHHATILGHTGQVCQFLKRNANQHAVDINGMNALEIAIQNANADIVTLLRLAKLNEEMKEMEGGYGGQDETFSDVFRDFTNMASNTPEKLHRRSSQASTQEGNGNGNASSQTTKPE